MVRPHVLESLTLCPLQGAQSNLLDYDTLKNSIVDILKTYEIPNRSPRIAYHYTASVILRSVWQGRTIPTIEDLNWVTDRIPRWEIGRRVMTDPIDRIPYNSSTRIISRKEIAPMILDTPGDMIALLERLNRAGVMIDDD